VGECNRQHCARAPGLSRTTGGRYCFEVLRNSDEAPLFAHVVGAFQRELDLLAVAANSAARDVDLKPVNPHDRCLARALHAVSKRGAQTSVQPDEFKWLWLAFPCAGMLIDQPCRKGSAITA
jgi:hypothetical protein